MIAHYVLDGTRNAHDCHLLGVSGTGPLIRYQPLLKLLGAVFTVMQRTGDRAGKV